MTDEEADEKEEATFNLERLSLYCNFSLILVRIYWPIDDLRKTIGSDAEQDPVALLMLKGIKNIKTKRWSKETLRVHNNWFDGKRSQYETSLRRFHTQLVSAVGNAKDTEGEKTPLPRKAFYFNPRTGDFRISGVSGNFNPKGQEFNVFRTLYESPEYIAPYLELIRSFRPHVEQASKAQKDDLFKIVDSIRKSLDTQKDVLQNVKNHGYRLVFPNQESSRE